MYILRKILPSRPVNIYFLADLHIGTVACDEELLKSTLEHISNDDSAVVIGLGDYADFITHTDPRYDPNTVDSDIYKTARERKLSIIEIQRERVLDELFPVRKKILALQPGTHEDKVERTYHFPLTESIARGLEVPLGDWLMYYQLVFKSKSRIDKLTILASHGSGNYGTLHGALAAVDKYRLDFDADVYAIAHSHFKAVVPAGRYIINNVSSKKPEHKRILKVLAGGFTKPITDTTVYTERTKIGCGSRVPGCSVITYAPFKKHGLSAEIGEIK